jgi:hypothetical protein
VKPWKLQKFFGDILYDLRSRNLLAIVIMLVVAIIAVPLIVSKSSKGGDPAAVSPTLQNASTTAPEAESAVLAYDPGVRNFKQRLSHLSAKNPFAAQFPARTTADALPGSSTTSGSVPLSTSSGASGVGNTGGGQSGSGNGGNSGNSGKSGGTKVKTQTYTYETDVLVGESGGALTLLSRIPQFTFLPTPDKPVLVYLGTTSGGSQAIFMVSRDVTSVGGQGTCFPSADDCQLLGLDPGKSADVIYGPDGKTYRLQVVRIKRFTK